MKKSSVGVLCCLLTLTLAACGRDEVDVQFHIEESIKIELEDYTPNYDFSSYVQATYNDESIDYSQIKITPKDTIELGECDFVASFEKNGEEYQNVFTVQFVDEYSTVVIYQLDGTFSRKVTNGTTLEEISMKSLYLDYKLTDFYSDREYKKEYDCQKAITEDTVLYAKSEYQPSPFSYTTDIDTLTGELDGYINSLLEQTSSYIPAWNGEGFKGRWNYIDGVFLNSIINLYYETGNVKYKNFFINYINYYIDEAGRFINPETKEETGFRSGELDSICESRILFDAYELTKDPRYLNAINYTYQALNAMPVAEGCSNFWHKTSYQNQIWLDGMYMYVPFYARYAKENNQPELFKTIKNQYQYIREHLFDEEKKLYYHGHDTTKSIFWADKITGNSSNFWLRSNGWLLVSLVDVLEYYPEGEDKQYLTSLLKEAIEGIMQYQDSESKLFYQLIDKGPMAYHVSQDYLKALKNHQYGNGSATIHNYLESSGSSMIAYVLMKAARLGYLNTSYETSGQEVFEAVYHHSYDNHVLKDICITAGLGPDSNRYRDGSIAYYLAEPVGENDAKGVGPFIMAYLEYAKLKGTMKTYHTITQILPTGSREQSFLEGTTFQEVWYSYLPGYVFDGFYYDEDYLYRIPLDTKIQNNMIVYMKYTSKQPHYEQLLASDAVHLAESFDSYTAEDSLPEFTTWGTKGVYYHINDKKEPGIDLTLNHIVLGDGTAYLYDNSENDGTQLIIDSGVLQAGVVKGHLDVSLEYAGNQWTFFQIYGERVDGTFGEVFGARFEDGVLKYRLNGGSTIYSDYEPIYPKEQHFSIDYIYDLDLKTLSVWMNDKPLVLEISMENYACSFGGIKIVSSDGFVKLYDNMGNITALVHRRATIDNIVMVVEQK